MFTPPLRSGVAFFDEKTHIEKIEKYGDKMINISMNKDI
jgi:hypothetical protein